MHSVATSLSLTAPNAPIALPVPFALQDTFHPMLQILHNASRALSLSLTALFAPPLQNVPNACQAATSCLLPACPAAQPSPAASLAIRA